MVSILLHSHNQNETFGEGGGVHIECLYTVNSILPYYGHLTIKTTPF